jgi:hypothetical protein
MRYTGAPAIINNVGNPIVGYDSSVNQWYVNITGIKDSAVLSSKHWYCRIMLYANGDGDYIYYTASTYNYNGML